MSPAVRHTLVAEGAPHNDFGVRIHKGYGYPGVGGPGRAKCSCGQLSEVLPSAYQRKAWHRAHKATNPADISVAICTRKVKMADPIDGICPECGHRLLRHPSPGERRVDMRCTGCIDDKIRAEHPPGTVL